MDGPGAELTDHLPVGSARRQRFGKSTADIRQQRSADVFLFFIGPLAGNGYNLSTGPSEGLSSWWPSSRLSPNSQ